MSEITEAINQILIDKLDLKERTVSEESTLFDDIGIDSIDFVDLIISFEVRFGIEIADEDVERFVTLGDLHHYIEKKVNEI